MDKFLENYENYWFYRNALSTMNPYGMVHPVVWVGTASLAINTFVGSRKVRFQLPLMVGGTIYLTAHVSCYLMMVDYFEKAEQDVKKVKAQK
jgi:hypothetical protein